MLSARIAYVVYGLQFKSIHLFFFSTNRVYAYAAYERECKVLIVF